MNRLWRVARKQTHGPVAMRRLRTQRGGARFREGGKGREENTDGETTGSTWGAKEERGDWRATKVERESLERGKNKERRQGERGRK
eukprot:894069-Pleurochrysis_carterae.AAC.1